MGDDDIANGLFELGLIGLNSDGTSFRCHYDIVVDASTSCGLDSVVSTSPKSFL